MPVTYFIGGVALIFGIGIFIYNWRHPTDDEIPSIEDSVKNSKVVWGFWHTGERAKDSFRYGSIKRVLLLEPNAGNESFLHISTQAQVTKTELSENIHITTEKAITNNIDIRWYDDPTVISFMICDSSPNIENNRIVNFSKRAYVVVQVIDAHISRSEWAIYKKTMAKDEYAFNEYVNWFKDIWDDRSKEALIREGGNGD